MGFLGAAVIPVLQGKLADTFSLPFSFLIAIVPYSFALFYVLKMMKHPESEKEVQQSLTS
jgi:fucose permease